MKKVAIGPVIALLIVALFVVPALAKGGSAKGVDITWTEASGTYSAIFHKTGSGIIQQWRYAPNDLHLIFKPQSKFSQPQEPGWSGWQFKSGNYSAGGTLLATVFTEDAWYWVKINAQ